MSYFKPIILPKNNIYKFWVKENFGGVFGGQNAQKCGKITIVRVLTPKNHPPKKISPKIAKVSFLSNSSLSLKPRLGVDFVFPPSQQQQSQQSQSPPLKFSTKH